MASKKTFWITAALVTAAIVLPFGSVLLVAGIAARKRKATKTEAPEQPYAAWYRLRNGEFVDRKS